MENSKITPTQLLFIRACKSENPGRRLRSVYRRYYGKYPEDIAAHVIAGELVDIIDSFTSIRLGQVISLFHPAKAELYGIGKDDDYWQATIKILTSKIRATANSEFPGQIIPAITRNSSQLRGRV